MQSQMTENCLHILYDQGPEVRRHLALCTMQAPEVRKLTIWTTAGASTQLTRQMVTSSRPPEQEIPIIGEYRLLTNQATCTIYVLSVPGGGGHQHIELLLHKAQVPDCQHDWSFRCTHLWKADIASLSGKVRVMDAVRWQDGQNGKTHHRQYTKAIKTR